MGRVSDRIGRGGGTVPRGRGLGADFAQMVWFPISPPRCSILVCGAGSFAKALHEATYGSYRR